MNNLKKTLSLAVASVMLISAPFTSYAEKKDNANKPVKVEVEKKNNNGKGNGNGNGQKNKNKNKNKNGEEIKLLEENEEEVVENLEEEVEDEIEETEEVEDETEETEEIEGNGKGKNKDWKIARDKYKDAKKDLKKSDKEINTQYKDLLKQMDKAESSGDVELSEQLKAQIEELENKKTLLKEERKELQFYMVEATRNKYSLEELEAIYKIGEEIGKEEEKVEVIPVENIIIEDGEIKFEVPPIVKDGRTLIPVRNLAEGFGAKVEWVAEEQKINITKDDITIVLQIDSNIATVNGQAVEIDTPAELYDERTYVPLRFIAESLGLEVNYDEETGIIEIVSGEEIELPELFLK